MKSPTLLAASFLTLIVAPCQTAKASDLGLNFSLEPPNRPANTAQAKSQPKALPHPSDPQTQSQPLPIPEKAATPPIAASSLPPPPTVYRGEVSLGDNTEPPVKRVAIPPPPPSPAPALPPKTAAAPSPKPRPVELDFDLDQATVAQLTAPSKPLARNTAQTGASLAPPNLFQGGTDSLVAKAVGSAEGTRTPDGHRTAAYYGHVDPGNRVWNLGTFSYQHGATSPEDADEKQLRRLQRQTQHLDQKANTQGVTLTLEEKLNGIDLANQAPIAALGRGGYVEWLSEAHRLGMTGPEAILWSRTRSFLDPDTQRWNAPGLGNTVASISHDQERRMQAIARTLNRHPLQVEAAIAVTPQTPSTSPLRRTSPSTTAKPAEPKAEAADIIFSVSLQPATIARTIPDPQTTTPLTNQPSSRPAATPIFRIKPEPTPTPRVPAPDVATRDQQTRIKDIPVEFPAFAPKPAASGHDAMLSPISQFTLPTKPLLIAQSERPDHPSIDSFLMQDQTH